MFVTKIVDKGVDYLKGLSIKGYQSNHEIFKSTKSFKRLKSTFDQNMRMNNNTNTSSYVVEVEL